MSSATCDPRFRIYSSPEERTRFSNSQGIPPAILAIREGREIPGCTLISSTPKRKLSAKPKAVSSKSKYAEQVKQRERNLAARAAEEARSKSRQKAFGVSSQKELLEAVKSQPEDSRKSFASRIKLGSGFRVFGKGSSRKKTTSFEAALLKKDDEPKPEKKKVSFAEAFVAKRKQA